MSLGSRTVPPCRSRQQRIGVGGWVGGGPLNSAVLRLPVSIEQDVAQVGRLLVKTRRHPHPHPSCSRSCSHASGGHSVARCTATAVATSRVMSPRLTRQALRCQLEAGTDEASS